MGLLRILESPLLFKELTELAAQRRTYVLRVIYALLLFGGGVLVLYGARVGGGLQGQGGVLFEQLVFVQHAAILLLVPAMTANALTVEKERETLPLLMLTRLRSSDIILQKYLSRVAPMVGYVMLSFPLMAVAYGYGGVTTATMRIAAIGLVLDVVYIAAWSLLCSTYFRTTLEAFAAAYFGLPLLSAISLGFVPLGALPWSAFRGEADIGQSVVRFVIAGMLTMGSLVMSVELLHSRAFVPPRNVLLILFQRLDRFFNEWNKVTGGVVLVHDGDRLPHESPVAWRETTKRSLGTFRYLFRVLVAIELPILFISQLVNLDMVGGNESMNALWYSLWGVAVAMIAIHASNVVSSERSRQSLEVLLTSPLPGRAIVVQKLAGVRRLLMVLLCPFLTIIAFEHWFRDYRLNLLFALQSTLLVLVLPRLIAWMSFLIGLRTRSSLAAILYSLACVAGVCATPILVELTARAALTGRAAATVLRTASLGPIRLLQLVHEHRNPRELQATFGWATETQFVVGFFIAITFYTGLLLLLRRLSCRHADRLLGRA